MKDVITTAPVTRDGQDVPLGTVLSLPTTLADRLVDRSLAAPHKRDAALALPAPAVPQIETPHLAARDAGRE